MAQEWAVFIVNLKGSSRISSMSEKDFLVRRTKFAKFREGKGLNFSRNW